MPSSFTTNKTIELPASGSDVNTWATPLNADWAIIDRAFGGVQALNVVALSGTQALTATQYQPPIINVSGTLTADVAYQFPTGVGGFWFVSNITTGAHNLSFSSGGAGRTVTIAQGVRAAIICDGTNVDPAFTVSPTAAGSTTQVQFNSSGVLGGSANLTWDGTTLALVGNHSIQGTLQFKGASSGSVSLIAPATGGTASYTLPGSDGTSGQYLTTNGAGVWGWTSGSGGGGGGVSSFSAGTTGLTPNVSTTGAITLAGVLGVANGGTGASTLTGVLIGNGASAVSGVTTIPYSLTINGTSGVSLTINGTSGTHSTKIADSATATWNAGYLETPQGAGGSIRTTDYTAVLSDSGKMILMAAGMTLTGTIPANASIPFPVGTEITWINSGAVSLNIAIVGSDTLILANSAAVTGTRTVAQLGVCITRKITTTQWLAYGWGVT